MGLSTAERNKRKRERKKLEREDQRKKEQAAKQAGESEVKREEPVAAGAANDGDDVDVEIEYVAEPLAPDAIEAVQGLDRLAQMQQEQEQQQQQRRDSSAVVSDDEKNRFGDDDDEDDEADDESNTHAANLSKRRLREKLRPSVADLKRRVPRPDLVEAHDVTAPDPDFLILLKAASGTVPVPRHWGRKRKYLQGKRGFERPPFQLPDFIVKTGITEIRDTVAEAESAMSAKQKNRTTVAPKMGAIDVDYRTLHSAFFKHQTKPTNLTKFGDLYFEGKEMEVDLNRKKTGVLSFRLREALGMASENSPPPWLLNMQRYGPPPSYPSMKIPGLNAPLPTIRCQYGFHPDGWGKPPIDMYGRALYGGNPFDPPGTGGRDGDDDFPSDGLVTSDGKTINKDSWGALPTGMLEEDQASEEEEEEESSHDEMEDSDEEEEEAAEDGEERPGDGLDSVLPPPANLQSSTAPVDLRKQAGDETPFAAPPKQLYQVIEQRSAKPQAGAVFASDVTYVVPGAAGGPVLATKTPDGAESVLSKAMPAGETAKRKRKAEDDEEDDLGKNFKF